MVLRREYTENCIRDTWRAVRSIALKEGHRRFWKTVLIEPDPMPNFDCLAAVKALSFLVTFERTENGITGTVKNVVVTVEKP